MAALGFCEEEVGFLRLLLLDTPEDNSGDGEYFPSFPPDASLYPKPTVVHDDDASLATAQELFRGHMLSPLDAADVALWSVHERRTSAAKTDHSDVSAMGTTEMVYPDHKRCRVSSSRAVAHQRSERSSKSASKPRVCSVPDCQKSSQSRGRCIRHGGGKRCSVENCTRGAQVTGRCKAHGGGIRCSVDGCSKSSQGSGLCRTHGGGKICIFPGCKKGTQRRGRCSAHGGARRCTVAGCGKIDRGGGFCESHKKVAAKTISNASIVW